MARKVPKVSLADPSREPTDDELEALMKAVQETVVIKLDEDERAHQARLSRAIEEGVAMRQADARRGFD